MNGLDAQFNELIKEHTIGFDPAGLSYGRMTRHDFIANLAVAKTYPNPHVPVEAFISIWECPGCFVFRGQCNLQVACALR